MPLNVARGGGSALRSLYLHAVSRPFRIAIPKPHVRRVSLAVHCGSLKPIAGATPSSNLLSRQLVNTYATDSEAKTDKKKTTAKAAPKKGKTTKAKKPAPKPKKKVLTDKQKEARDEKTRKQRLNELKLSSLEPPKKGSNSWWTYALTDVLPQVHKTHSDKHEAFRVATQLIKDLSQEEKDRYVALAKSRRDRYQTEYEEFIKSYTPAQIRDANRARRRLATLTGGRYTALRDERLVKPPTPPYAFYFNERFETGDFKHMSLIDMQNRIRDEFMGLIPSEKQKYSKLSEDDRARYLRECQEVYGDQPSAN